MTYGYTIADSADRKVFQEAFRFVTDTLRFVPDGKCTEDVDGSIYQHFTKGDVSIILESDVETNYVAIRSDKEFPIKVLHKWTQEAD